MDILLAGKLLTSKYEKHIPRFKDLPKKWKKYFLYSVISNVILYVCYTDSKLTRFLTSIYKTKAVVFTL